mmetsp:Transcript_23431/g.67794  ORF Transcript_23431/g.67794 Transcript_23431/m.67794 type:complete len:209 (+) Transcript_23431:211-837(+)
MGRRRSPCRQSTRHWHRPRLASSRCIASDRRNNPGREAAPLLHRMCWRSSDLPGRDIPHRLQTGGPGRSTVQRVKFLDYQRRPLLKETLVHPSPSACRLRTVPPARQQRRVPRSPRLTLSGLRQRRKSWRWYCEPQQKHCPTNQRPPMAMWKLCPVNVGMTQVQPARRSTKPPKTMQRRLSLHRPIFCSHFGRRPERMLRTPGSLHYA